MQSASSPWGAAKQDFLPHQTSGRAEEGGKKTRKRGEWVEKQPAHLRGVHRACPHLFCMDSKRPGALPTPAVIDRLGSPRDTPSDLIYFELLDWYHLEVGNAITRSPPSIVGSSSGGVTEIHLFHLVSMSICRFITGGSLERGAQWQASGRLITAS